MPRRREVPKRDVLPDPKFGNVELSKFMNVVMMDGKKSVAERIVYGALAQIEKQFGKGTIMKLGEGEVLEDIQVVSTGSLGLDIALGVGGLPRGRVVEIYGPESSGKTTLALQTIAEAQKRGGICAFIDAEHALDPEYAQKLGVDIDSGRLQPGPCAELSGNPEAFRTLLRGSLSRRARLRSVGIRAGFVCRIGRDELEIHAFRCVLLRTLRSGSARLHSLL